MTAPAAILAAVLFLAMAGFQAVLAMGAPLGQHVLGGRHPRIRIFSGIAAAVLAGGAVVVLARAAVIGWPTGMGGLLAPAAWLLAAFLALNTLGNLTSKSRLERTLFAATTATLAILCAFVAFAGPGPGS